MKKQTDGLSYDDFDDDGIEDMGDDPVEPVLVEFLVAWENANVAKERDAILQEYSAKHPDLEEDFRGLAEARGGIDRVEFLTGQEDADPDQLGPYRIIRLRARGGMGKVYEAEEKTPLRRVAVKTIRLGRAADAKLVEQFKAEREALALLHHSNIVPIFSAGEEDGLLYFAMPLINGLTLADLVATMRQPGPAGPGTTAPASSLSSWADVLRLAKTKASHRHTLERLSARFGVRMSHAPSVRPSSDPDDQTPKRFPFLRPPDYERRVAEIIAVAAEAIHSAHEAGVLHLDVKPSNILIETISNNDPLSLHPWVIDFGLVDAVNSRSGDDSVASADRVRQTRGFGTKGFMAPEMIVIGDVEPEVAIPSSSVLPAISRATDIWSLGVTLYQLLTLRLPFTSDQQTIGPEGPIPPRRFVPALSRELEAVVLKALQKRPEHRYSTAADFANDLRRWLTGFPTVAGEASYPKRLVIWTRRRPAAAFAAGMTSAFVIATFVGAAQTVRTVRADAKTAHAKVSGARAKARAAELVAQANQRELDLIDIARIRAPIRTAGWFDNAWDRTRELTAGRPDHVGRFQGQFTTLLEGIDVRLRKSFAMNADMLVFDTDGNRLLMGGSGQNAKSPITGVAIGEVSGQSELIKTRFESFGVVGFHPDGVARFLELDPNDRARLRLRNAVTGKDIRVLKSPLDGATAITAHTLSRDGSRAAGIVWPLRKRTPEERAAGPEQADEMTPAGKTATLVVWDLSTGGVLLSIAHEQSRSHGVILSPDGSIMASWDTEGQVRAATVWAVSQKTLIGKFPSTNSGITSVAFGRDPVWREDAKRSQWRLALGERGGMVTVWDVNTGAVKCQARGSVNDVKTMDFSPDGTLLASAGRDELRIWDAASGMCLLTKPAGSHQFAVAFSTDGHRVAVAKVPGRVDVYDLDEGRGMRTLRGLQQRIEKIVISTKGGRVAALSNDSEVGVFDTDSGALLGVVEAPEGDFTDNAALALDADGKRLVCSAGTNAKLWDVEKRQLLREWKLPPALTEAAAFRPDGRLILLRQETQGAKLPPDSRAPSKDHPRVCRAYELPEQGDPKKTAEIAEFNSYVEHIAATPDAAYFAVQGSSSTSGKLKRLIHLYNGSTWAQVGAIPTNIPANDTATGMRFDPKGLRLHVVVGNNRNDVFEVPSLRPVGSMEHAAKCVNVGASRWLFAGGGTADTPEMLVLNERGRDDPVLRIIRDVKLSGSDGIKFSPDGNHIVWGNQDGTVTVCDLNEVQRRLASVGLGWE